MNIPNPRDELTRKSALAVEELIRRAKMREITIDALLESIRVVWEISSGLIDDEVSETISQIHDSLSKKHGNHRRT